MSANKDFMIMVVMSASVKYSLKIKYLACLYSCLTCSDGTSCGTCPTNSVAHRTKNTTTNVCDCDAAYYEQSP